MDSRSDGPINTSACPIYVLDQLSISALKNDVHDAGFLFNTDGAIGEDAPRPINVQHSNVANSNDCSELGLTKVKALQDISYNR